MSMRRLLNTLGDNNEDMLSQNPMELVMPRPKVVQNFIPNEPIFLTKAQWDFICSKTVDVSTPFKVEVTVTDNQKQDEEVKEEVKEEEVKEEEGAYIPKRGRTKK